MHSKRLLALLGLSLATASHAHALVWPEACGRDDVQFKVKTQKNQPIPAADAGKAQIVFVESLTGDFGATPTTRFGVDGTWAGADRGVSYFTISVTPGTHHLCASRQTSIKAERENIGVATVTAEAGKVYIYEFRITRSEIGTASMRGGAMLPGQYPGSMTAKPKDTADSVVFTQLSDDQGKAMLKDAPLSTSTAKN